MSAIGAFATWAAVSAALTVGVWVLLGNWDRLRDEVVHRYRRWRWERDNPDEWRV